MNHILEVFLGVILCAFLTGCADIPSAGSALETQASSPLSFEDTWRGSVETIKALGGSILTEDGSAGLIGCRIPSGTQGRGEYVNVYVRREAEAPGVCCVYVVPYAFLVNPGRIRRIEEEGTKTIVFFEFNDVLFRKNHLSEVSNAFFNRLTDRVGQGKL